MPKGKAIVMASSQNAQSRDLLVLSILDYNSHILYQISTNFLEKRSHTCLTKPVLMKQNAWAQTCEKNYL